MSTYQSDKSEVLVLVHINFMSFPIICEERCEFFLAGIGMQVANVQSGFVVVLLFFDALSWSDIRRWSTKCVQ